MASVSRRELLGMAAAAAGSSPIISVARNFFPPQRPILGSGEHTYECYHDWLVPPSDIKWGDTQGLALDAQNRIYVSHTVHPDSPKKDAILVFDQEGKFIKSWGSEFNGGGHGLDIRKEGGQEFLYHCDTNRRLVVKTTLDGEVLWEKGVPMDSGVYPDETHWRPTNVAFHPDGSVFVADGYGSSYIHKYSKDGDYHGVIIKPGSERGFVREPHGLWVDHRDGWSQLVVADRGNGRLQRFTLDGHHIDFVTDGMRRPCHIHYNHDLVLVPDLASVVTILDKDNKVVAQLGDGKDEPELRDAPRDKFVVGKFVHPHAAIWINPKDILVVEWVPIGRVTRLKRVS